MTGDNRLAVVTASASGIGLAVARALAAEGWRVAMCDLDGECGQAEARKIGADFQVVDMGRPEQVAGWLGGLGPVHLLVNNSGIAGPTLPVAELPLADWQRVFDVNVTAHFLACQCVVPGMVERRQGVIVNMASVAARIGYANRSPYCASKWAVLGLTGSLAREVGPFGVRVNAILPGSVRGERIMGVIRAYAAANQVDQAAAEAYYLKRQATGAFVEPEEIAATIVFLASDAARSITGQFIGVDGGFE